MSYHNPYYQETFLGFFVQLALRLWALLKGEFPLSQLASDEIQVLVLLGVAASSALVGSFLVLRKMTMLANSLSHTILLGIVIAYLISRDSFLSIEQQASTSMHIEVMLLAALIMGLITAFLTEFLTKTAKLQEDASTGLVFTSLFALGIVLVTLFTRSAHIGTEVVMGNVDALHVEDLKLVYVILAINVALFLLFFKEYKITTFDAGLAKAFGISLVFFNYLLMTQVSVTAIGAFRAVGVLMVLAFITGPPLTARLLTHDLKKMLWIAIGLGCLASLLGVALSRHMLTVYGETLSTAGLVVCMIAGIFVCVLIFRYFRMRCRVEKNHA